MLNNYLESLFNPLKLKLRRAGVSYFTYITFIIYDFTRNHFLHDSAVENVFKDW